MRSIKAVIIDDEQPARELIKVYLRDHPLIKVVGEAENGFAGAKLINELAPELVFLDIQMPKIDGFEMLELLDCQPQIIFCTAYDQFAITAFEKKAVDYLLKPFARNRFSEALAKVQANTAPVSNLSALPSANDYQQPLKRIVVKDRKEIIIIDVQKIEYLEAQDDYVEIHTRQGKWLKQQTMKYFEQALEGTKFIRVHRKYIVHLDEIAKLDKLGKESHLAILKSGASIPVSTAGYRRLKVQLGI
jgi:two-component system, LytTR family, response regulator